MADPTSELILEVLQQIQATQGAHTRLFEEHTSGFTRLGRRLDEVQESMTMTRRIEVLERAK